MGCSEAGHGNRAMLVALRGPDDEPVTDLHRVLSDIQPAGEHVDIPRPHAGGLTPAQAAVGENQDERA